MAGNLRKGGMPEPGETSQVDDIVEAIIDYIATTPQNINYNMLREMLNAFYNGNSHPYFIYYQLKNESETEESAPTDPDLVDPDNLNPSGESSE